MRQHRTYPVRAVITWSLVGYITLSGCIRGACAQFSGGPGAGGAQGCLPTMIVLPVSMLHMVASCEDGRPTIRWMTSSERNSSHFIIERSADAVVWQTVGEVRAAGHSQQVIEYAWRDEDALFASERYYRLRQVDRDGAEELFHVLGVERCGGSGAVLVVHPNPATDACTVHFQQERESEGPLVLHLADAYGRELQRTTLSAKDMHLSHRIALDHLAPGTYHITMRSAMGAVIAHTTLIRR